MIITLLIVTVAAILLGKKIKIKKYVNTIRGKGNKGNTGDGGGSGSKEGR